MAARDGIVGGPGGANSVLPASMLSAGACWLFVAVVVRFLLLLKGKWRRKGVRSALGNEKRVVNLIQSR
jgi:hypothetical protein